MSRRWWAWAALNVAGMVVYLQLASDLWVLPGEEGQPGGPGDAFYWALVLVPYLAGLLVIEAGTLLFIVFLVPKADRGAVQVLWLTVVALWLAAVGYAHFRGVRTIDAKVSVADAGPHDALTPGPRNEVLKGHVSRAHRRAAAHVALGSFVSL